MNASQFLSEVLKSGLLMVVMRQTGENLMYFDCFVLHLDLSPHKLIFIFIYTYFSFKPLSKPKIISLTFGLQ